MIPRCLCLSILSPIRAACMRGAGRDNHLRNRKPISRRRATSRRATSRLASASCSLLIHIVGARRIVELHSPTSAKDIFLGRKRLKI